ncbi:MAG: hypothetical protein K2V38_04365 [Gemmataceae bacterium]|nr:hypothetical protein [Gemmataceae bacterium]
MGTLTIDRGSRKGRTMDKAKALCFGALGVGGLMLLVFLLDLIAGVPFGGNKFMTGDILGLLASAVVIYLGYNALRDLQ